MQIITEYQKENFNTADKLKKEMEALGFQAEVIKDKNNNFNVIINNKYRITRDWKGYIKIYNKDNKHYNLLSSHEKTNIYTKHEGHFNKMKVMNKKKVTERLQAIDGYTKELDALELQYKQERNDFLESLKNENVFFSYNNHNIKKDIKGGYIKKNGLEYSFEFSQDGYIGKKIVLDLYSVDKKNNLTTFNLLADNKLK